MSQGDLGNTNTKSFRARRVCFTLHRYFSKHIEEIETLCHTKGWSYIFSEEKGKNGNTKHLQGYIENKEAIRCSLIKKKFPTIHLEKAKGSRDQNVTYIKKEGGRFYSNLPKSFKEKLFELNMKKYENVKWKKWQQFILDTIVKEPDDRKVYWFYDKKGNCGKTYLAKYVALNHDVIICDGKSQDIFNQVKTFLDEEKLPSIVIIDIPRCSLDYINYSTIEKLKNGFIYSGKYEGGQCIFPSPHVFIFANEKPETENLSLDRWIIKNITEKKALMAPTGDNILRLEL